MDALANIAWFSMVVWLRIAPVESKMLMETFAGSATSLLFIVISVLIVSLALNVVLLSPCAFLRVKESILSPHCVLKFRVFSMVPFVVLAIAFAFHVPIAKSL